MPRPVYFDTNVFLDIFTKTSQNKPDISRLLAELKDGKVAIYTSILTISETSVLTYRRGQIAHANYALINNLARVQGIDKVMALTTVKREAEIRDIFAGKTGKDAEEEMKQRRRWDCFHIVTAQVLECSHLYTTDPGMVKRKGQLSIPDLQIVPPKPVAGTSSFPVTGSIALVPPRA